MVSATALAVMRVVAIVSAAVPAFATVAGIEGEHLLSRAPLDCAGRIDVSVRFRHRRVRWRAGLADHQYLQWARRRMVRRRPGDVAVASRASDDQQARKHEAR